MSVVTRTVDAVAPPRMGANFRRLLASSWVSDTGDGIALAAGPLLVASQTGDPFLVALATLLQRLPWGITARFWFGFVGSAVILAVIWRTLALIALAERGGGARTQRARRRPGRGRDPGR